MKNVWQQIRLLIPVAVIALLLLSLPCPTVLAHNGTTSNGQTTVTPTTPEEQAQSTQKAAAKPKPKPVAKTRDKSVLDAEVLDSPLSYFKEAFTPEEENDSNGSPALVNTVKALVATLLSTVM